ncbi:hypothetical protein BOTBODRAFT_70958 [Botryobasidium botryosum FD-172 SS1]|uniref:C2H2-type domain-containing protein n=1 Tax=Botryobasidium botryosum (strain FD-172 SS1) TaxID=930990 RepID=A0A067LVW9_BOTB1|nr:hypothetical protein BOTBODRAFT_70958 [Botryobasidium botryosum FD-172 SS1]
MLAMRKTLHPYHCDICSKAYGTLAHLRRHKKNIHDPLTAKCFPCPVPSCSYKTNQKSNLVHHARSHSSEKPFECNFCSKQFKSRQAMQRHQMGPCRRNFRPSGGIQLPSFASLMLPNPSKRGPASLPQTSWMLA